MSDDLDELLRRAMATLDRQAPEGYFDALPERTLARLDDPDVLDDLARERAARSARAHPLAHASPSEPAPERSAEGAAPAPPAAAEAPDPAARRRPRRATVAVGAGLAAAAVALLFVSMETRTAMSPPRTRNIVATGRETSREQVEAVRPIREQQAAESTLSQLPRAAPPAPLSPASPERPSPSLRMPSSPAQPEPSAPAPPAAPSSAFRSPRSPAPHASSSAVSDPLADEQLAPDVPAQRDGRDAPPSIDHFTLAAAPPLSAQDVELAMRALTDRFAACLRGARGKAIVDATFRPSGELSAVTLAAPLAGTPAETCVRRVLGDVRFPSWTGSPRTFRFALVSPEVRSIP